MDRPKMTRMRETSAELLEILREKVWILGAVSLVAIALLQVLYTIGHTFLQGSMVSLAEYVFWFGLVVGPIIIWTVGILFLFARSSVSFKGKLGFTMAGYFLIAGVMGWFAYEFVPAQYTQGHDWHWPPTSNSLGSIHRESLRRAANPEVTLPANAAVIRQRVHQERIAYLRDGLTIVAVGAAFLLVLVLPTGKRLLRRREARGGIT